MYFQTRPPVYKKPTWKEWHHYYTGFILSSVSFILMFEFWSKFWFIMGLLGFWWSIDDILQHLLQLNEYREKKYYTIRSFWNWFPYYLLHKIRNK